MGMSTVQQKIIKIFTRKDTRIPLYKLSVQYKAKIVQLECPLNSKKFIVIFFSSKDVLYLIALLAQGPSLYTGPCACTVINQPNQQLFAALPLGPGHMLRSCIISLLE